MMKLTRIVAVVFVITLTAASASGQERAPILFNFDSDTVGQPPKGFELGRTGGGAEGTWIVRAENDAPSRPNVLAQENADTTDYRFPIAFTGPDLKDLLISVKGKPVSGKGDQGFGLVFRLKDVDNYYVTRPNALEDNVGLYHVVKGSRVQFAGWNGKVKSGVWHDLAVECVGDHFQVFFDGRRVIDAHDRTFPDAGKFGLWTKADSVISFDDLNATPK
jgi:hypothetical protein